MRALIVFGSLCVVLVAVAGCGSEDGGSCTAATCTGCCQNGMCTLGSTAAACGVGGKACVACLSGTTCVAGQCKAGGACNASTCPAGCCTQQGECLIYSLQSSAGCGTGGAACQPCGAGQCVSGTCQTNPGCNASSCGGCCNSQTCLPITQQSATACGTNAIACQNCNGGTCVNGQCQGGCNASNCAGCCNGQTCLPIAQQGASACGTGGAACQSCGAGQCNSGQCQGTTCNASNCGQGCCNSQSLCVLYAAQSATACGTNGAACQSCGANPCASGQCQTTPSCSGSTCAQGCCTSTKQCIQWAQQTAGACGTAGNPCGVCSGSGISCLSGQCTAAWKVSVISAIVKQKASGTWDSSGSMSGLDPDPFVIVKVNANSKTGQTKYIDDTFNPVFNQQVLVESEQLLSTGVTCEVREDDGIFPSELMGTCSTPALTTAMLQSGQVKLQSCTDHVTEVVLGFAK